jgi:hypothetical protein
MGSPDSRWLGQNIVCMSQTACAGVLHVYRLVKPCKPFKLWSWRCSPVHSGTVLPMFHTRVHVLTSATMIAALTEASPG